MTTLAPREIDADALAAGLLHSIFEAQVDRRPDALALVQVGSGPAWTYAELEAEAERLAVVLARRGVRRGSLVGILLERGPRPIVAILACLKAGAGYVPLEPGYPEERIRYIVEEAGIRVIVAERATAPLAEAAAPGLALALDAIAEELASAPSGRGAVGWTGTTPDDLCYVIYTSGTTGRPKGVMTEHRNAHEFVLSFDRVCSTTPSDRVYQGFALSFDGSVEEIWMAFSNGAALVVPEPSTPRFGDDLATVLEAEGVTYFSTVPTMLSTIGRDVPTLRQLVVSGEVCPPELVERWATPGRRMLNVYGPTEATVNTTAVGLLPGRPVTIGRPIPGYSIHVLDESLCPVPEGAEGELYVGGVGVARGYLGRPDLTAERFVTSPHVDGGTTRLYRTGDLVRQREDGELDFFGRLDGQVKIRGFRVELAEIESVLRTDPRVAAAAARLADRDGLPVLAAYVVPADPAAPPDPAVLHALLAGRLPGYMVPGYLDLLDALPLLTSGKTDRSRLPAPRTPLAAASDGVAAGEIVAPRTPLEGVLAAAWAELFGLARISVDADFFLDLGGHSLLAARVVALVRERCDVDLAVRDVYASPSIRALAATLLGRDAAAAIGAGSGAAATESGASWSRPTVEPDRDLDLPTVKEPGSGTTGSVARLRPAFAATRLGRGSRVTATTGLPAGTSHEPEVAPAPATAGPAHPIAAAAGSPVPAADQPIPAWRAGAEPGPRAADVVASVPVRVRRLTTALMAASLAPLYGIPLLPVLVFALLEVRVLEDGLDPLSAIALGIVLSALSIPAALALGIAGKWLIVGRYRPGVHALWTPFHWRRWLVDRLVALSGAQLLLGTPLMPLYYRLMGARVGRDCVIDTVGVSAWDLVSIGDGASIGGDTVLGSARVEAGRIILDRVEIGPDCFVGSHVHLGPGVRLETGARVDDHSMIPDGTVVPVGAGRRGSPPVPADVPIPAGEPYRPSRRRLAAVGTAQLALGALVEGVMALPTTGVFLALFAIVLTEGLGTGLAALLVLLPLDVVANALWFALVRRVVLPSGRPGVHRLYGSTYIRKWLSDLVVLRSRQTLYPVLTTIYLPYWLRLMGARIGARTEFSTIRNISPELLEVGAESFFADDVALGGRRVHHGLLQLSVDRIGRRTFVGNSALIPAGAELGDGCLLGVLSAAPMHLRRAPDGTDWLGSPAFQLPNRQRDHHFDDSVTYRPTRTLVVQRSLIDGLRILVPTLFSLALVQLEAFAVVTLSEVPGDGPLEVAAAIAVLPVIAALGAVAAVAFAVAVKWLVVGRFRPVVVPLWSRYVWWNELVNCAYEWLMLPAIAPLFGTPFVAGPLRLLGVRVGRDTHLASAWFSEFDLVEIGDHAVVGEGATIQTHLFEDRVMKSSWSVVESGATVGPMSVVLYDAIVEEDAIVGPLSLVMKGEAIPSGRRAQGIPSIAVGRAVPETAAARAAGQAADRAGAPAGERVVILSDDGWVVGRVPLGQLEGLLAARPVALDVVVPHGSCRVEPAEILFLVREREFGRTEADGAGDPLALELGAVALVGRLAPRGLGAPFQELTGVSLRFPDGRVESAGRVHLARRARRPAGSARRPDGFSAGLPAGAN